MAWEPWLKGHRKAEEEEEEKYDPNDPSLLVNSLTKNMTEEDRQKARDWITDHLLPENS